MNREAFPSFQVQQMVGGVSPNWWEMSNMRPPPSQILASSSSTPSLLSLLSHPSAFVPVTSWNDTQDLPESWSQFLLHGGLVEDEAKKAENWEEQQALYISHNSSNIIQIKQEMAADRCYNNPCSHICDQEIQSVKSAGWNVSQIPPTSSPASCVTRSLSNMLDFSNSNSDKRHHQPDHSSECNSTATASPYKKARVQSSAQSTFKVRKEKLGDRITALHQLVSPFGKTDTASVLSEAISYIRFLQSQIEALSSQYFGTPGSPSNIIRKSVRGEEMSCIFQEDPRQLLNNPSSTERGGTSNEESSEFQPKKDLRSRGLCLVPLSCMLHVGNDTGADYWAPAAFGGGFR